MDKVGAMIEDLRKRGVSGDSAIHRIAERPSMISEYVTSTCSVGSSHVTPRK